MKTKEMFFYNDNEITNNENNDEPSNVNTTRRRYSARKRIEDYMESKELKQYISEFDF